MQDYLIYNQLKKHAGATKSFHVPGHKAAPEFAKKFPVADLDVTELSYSDNLHCPTGVIAAAQKDLAEILGARRTYILTDGSSCGIHAMLYAASRRGTRIIVPRNSHQSVWNACRVLGLEPIVVQGETVNDIMLPPAAEQVEKLLERDASIAGMLAVNPDYYGNFSPLKEYSEVLKKYAKLLIVDEAHGSHLAFESKGRGYAGEYADMWVDGAHKGLPVLTQGATLSISDAKYAIDIEDGLSIFRTTSPSYPIMASVEYGFKYLKNNEKKVAQAKLAVAAFKVRAESLHIYPADDWTKIAVDFSHFGISADSAAQALEKQGIYAELSDGRYLLFYLSPLVSAGELAKLEKALFKVIENKKIAGSFRPRPELPVCERNYSFLYAQRSKTGFVPVAKSAGKMCARNAGIMPPCIPVVLAGEIITEEHIAALQDAAATFGLINGYIRVVQNK